jgi:hypothetical protein
MNYLQRIPLETLHMHFFDVFNAFLHAKTENLNLFCTNSLTLLNSANMGLVDINMTQANISNNTNIIYMSTNTDDCI